MAMILRVTTQAIWSWVAESEPCICGKETLAMVTVMAYKNVTPVQVARMQAAVQGLRAVTPGSAPTVLLLALMLGVSPSELRNRFWGRPPRKRDR